MVWYIWLVVPAENAFRLNQQQQRQQQRQQEEVGQVGQVGQIGEVGEVGARQKAKITAKKNDLMCRIWGARGKSDGGE